MLSRADGKPVQAGLCIIVLGMHRSGTSAMTRLLSHAGLALPKTPLGSNEFNPAGHWEPIPLLRANERFMRLAGFDWDDLRRFPLEALSRSSIRAFVSEVAGLISEEYGGSQAIVLKDPRLSLLLPLYERALTALDYRVATIVMVRACHSVARSLCHRDGMLEPYGRALWLRYTLEAEWNSRRRERMVVAYESLVHDPASVVANVDGWLRGLVFSPQDDWEAEAIQSVRADLQHYQSQNDVADQWSASIQSTESALSRLAVDVDDAGAHSAIDAALARMDVSAHDILDLVYAEMRRRQAVTADLVGLERGPR